MSSGVNAFSFSNLEQLRLPLERRHQPDILRPSPSTLIQFGIVKASMGSTLLEGVFLVGSFLVLTFGGWVFVSRNVYSAGEKRSVVASSMFALMFSMSAVMVELLTCEVTNSLNTRWVIYVYHSTTSIVLSY